VQTITYVCDRCGATIPGGDRSTYQPSVGPHRHDQAIDLCHACDTVFRDWLAAGVLDADRTTRSILADP
jgi:hypothetical protein